MEPNWTRKRETPSSVGRASDSRSKQPEVRTAPASVAQEQFVTVFPSQRRSAESLSVCPTPVCTRTHGRGGSIGSRSPGDSRQGGDSRIAGLPSAGSDGGVWVESNERETARAGMRSAVSTTFDRDKQPRRFQTRGGDIRISGLPSTGSDGGVCVCMEPNRRGREVGRQAGRQALIS